MRHTDSDTKYSDCDANRNRDAYGYSKTFAHTEASSDPGASPVMGKDRSRIATADG